MKPRIDAATFAFALMGATILLYLITPLAYLFFRVDWHGAGAALQAPRTREAIAVSLVTSSVSTLLMTVLGVPLGYLLARGTFRGRDLITGLVFVPMVLPPLVSGLLLLSLWGPYGWFGAPFETHGIEFVNNRLGIVLAQLFVASPYVIVASLSAFGAVDVRLEHVAATLGDSSWRVFWRVALPLAWPGISAGIILAWLRTLGEFGATLVMAYHPNTVPVYLWVQLTSEGLEAALPIALLMLCLSIVTLIVAHGLRSIVTRRGTGKEDV